MAYLSHSVRRPLLLALFSLGAACAAGACAGTADDTVASDTLDTGPVAVTETASALPEDWHRRAVFMEIYVRGYKDSDGDGVGDFAGLTAQLDYLAELGIGGIWLMPMTESWDDDHGYAVADYRAVESDYGTLAEFETFVAEAHARGIGVIVDYVINHSAKDNPLFRDSWRDLGGKRDWYVWRENNPGWSNWGGDPSWHRIAGAFYYGVFWDQMPDFNLRNDEVLQYHADNLRFWLNRGVDGFRFDAVGTLVENGADAWESQEENYAIMKQMRAVLGDYEHRFLICEEPAQPLRAAADDACGAAFGFGLNYDLVASAREGALREGVLDYLADAPNPMGIIQANHDAFAGDRLYAQYGGDEQVYKLAAAVQLSLPGIPFVYYGEEIGMGRGTGVSGDHALRAPMSWTDDKAGFTSGTPYRGVAENVRTHNVADEREAPDSLLNHYKALIALRNQHESLALGSFTALASGELFGFRRDAADESALVLAHYGGQAQATSLDAGVADARWRRVLPADDAELVADGEGVVSVELAARSVEIYLLAPE